MHFGVLGPLEVLSTSGPVNIPGLRQRKILGTLLLSANASVSLDRLVDVLWGEAPPRTAREQVQNCVGRLASAISSTSAQVIRGNSVYTLRVNAETVDAIAFRRASSHVQEVASAGNGGSVKAVLRAALDLWRGDVLADVVTDGMRAEAAELEELRIRMIEQYAEAVLRSGEPQLAISELSSAVVRQPFNERLCAQLMRALHLSGRSAEALHLFTDMRDRLLTALGVQPGSEIVQAHRLVSGSGRLGPLRVASARRDGTVGIRPHGAATQPDAEAIRLVNEAQRLLKNAMALIEAHAQPRARCQTCTAAYPRATA